MAVKKRLAKFGSQVLFEFAVGVMHDKIVEEFRKFLSSIHPEDIPGMVRKSRFPSLEHLDFFAVSDNAEYLESIPLVSKDVPPGSPPPKLGLLDYIAEARPDLAQAIQDMGMPGAKYIAKLRQHLLNLVKHPEEALAKSTNYEPSQKMVRATCDKCGFSWPVPEAKVSSLDNCPKCGQ